MQKTNIPQAESKSADLVAQNLEQLKQIFPEVIKEGRVDFDALNDLLGNYADTAEERFCLNWAGKANARREAQKRSTGTLRPCPEESVDWDSTDNLYIEGDNLEVLKLLQKSYHSRIKMIYIDPPYNTGKDFVYKDNYADNMKNYLELTGQDKKLSTNTESDGRYHSNWLNMMYPRLKLARNLLTDDGVIFISIDDNEVANLRKVCDEIFGEENFIGTLSVENNPKGRKNSDFISVSSEFLLIYARIKSATHFIENIPKNASDMTIDENGNYVHNSGKRVLVGENGFNKPINNSDSDKNYSVYYRKSDKSVHLIKEIYGENDQSLLNEGYKKYFSFYGNQLVENTYTIAKFETLLKEGALEFTENKIFEKNFNDTIRIKSQLINRKYEAIVKGKKQNYSLELTTTGAGAYLKILFETDALYFDAPKNPGLLRVLLTLFDDKEMTILDFFSGSATTAHAVMQLNAEDGGNRKYICVQIPEPTPEGSEARKAGYATIPEIAKERIRRAGKKIVEEQNAKIEKEGGLFADKEEKRLDTGFKVFKLDSSNINAWDSDPDNLETALNNSLFNIKEDRSEDDLLYEILIKYGIELTEKINRHIIDGKTVYEMGAGSLIVCLAESLSTAVADGIGKLYKEVSPEGVDANCRVVFKEAGFNGSDEVKTNTLLILKQHGITNVATV